MRASSRTTHLLSLFVLPMQSRLCDQVYVSRDTLMLGGEGRGGTRWPCRLPWLGWIWKRGWVKRGGRTSYEREL